VWWGIPQKAVNLEDLNTSVISADAQKQVEAKREELAGGKWDVFTGPIKDQSGAVKVPAGKTLADPELQRLNWYVEGVDGSLPK
jgi:simple sugar transport system substrate-binding protein